MCTSSQQQLGCPYQSTCAELHLLLPEDFRKQASNTVIALDYQH
jgi:hypothetical protein